MGSQVPKLPQIWQKSKQLCPISDNSQPPDYPALISFDCTDSVVILIGCSSAPGDAIFHFLHNSLQKGPSWLLL